MFVYSKRDCMQVSFGRKDRCCSREICHWRFVERSACTVCEFNDTCSKLFSFPL